MTVEEMVKGISGFGDVLSSRVLFQYVQSSTQSTIHLHRYVHAFVCIYIHTKEHAYIYAKVFVGVKVFGYQDLTTCVLHKMMVLVVPRS